MYDTRDEKKAQKPRKLHLIPIRKWSWIEAKQIGIGIYKTVYNNIIKICSKLNFVSNSLQSTQGVGQTTNAKMLRLHDIETNETSQESIHDTYDINSGV